MLSAIVCLAAGIVLLLASELAGIAPIRVVAVALLACGGVGVGVAAGLGPRMTQTPKRIARRLFSRTAICAAAIILATPDMMAMTGALAGAAARLSDTNSAVDTPPVIAAGVVGLFLLALTILALVVGISAIRGKAPNQAAKE